MNRTTALTAAGLLLVALPLAACTSSKPAEPAQQGQPAGGATAAPTAAASSMAAPAKASKNYNLQFIQGVAGDEFYITMQCGMEAEAAKLGVSVKTQGAQKFDPTLQKPILDSVVAGKPDAILIAPTDVTAMQHLSTKQLRRVSRSSSSTPPWKILRSPFQRSHQTMRVVERPPSRPSSSSTRTAAR